MNTHLNQDLQTAIKAVLYQEGQNSSKSAHIFGALLIIRDSLKNTYYYEENLPLPIHEQKEKDLLIIAEKALKAYIYGFEDLSNNDYTDGVNKITNLYKEAIAGKVVVNG